MLRGERASLVFVRDQQRQRRATSPPTWFKSVSKQRPPKTSCLTGFPVRPNAARLRAATQERAQGGHDAQISSLADGWFCGAVRPARLVGGPRRGAERPSHVGRGRGHGRRAGECQER